jgi:hypothetical protein
MSITLKVICGGNSVTEKKMINQMGNGVIDEMHSLI